MPFMMESAIDPGGDLDVAMYVVLSAIGLCLECMAYTKLYQWSIRWYAGKTGGTEKDAFRPGRTQDIFGIVWSGLFVLTGLLVMIPVFGVFGVIWTLGAGALTVVYIRQLLGKRHVGAAADKNLPSAASSDVRRQLEQLETLRAAGLLTGEEYREKRRRILEEL